MTSTATVATSTTDSFVGFDPLTRRWVGEAANPAVDPVPLLVGEVVLAADAIAEASHDLGNQVSKRPGAILRPASADDIARMIVFCRRHAIPVAARGEAHTTHGQGLTSGLIIDMRTLDTIHSIGSHGAEVDAGVLWLDLVIAAAEQGLRFPALTSYLGLTVGGTLSVGGISCAHKEGSQLDKVQALQVVTGRGEIEWCSPIQRADLFQAALGGLGQVAVITRAIVDLTPAPAMVRTYVLGYVDPQIAFATMRHLIDRGEVDEVFCMILPPVADTQPVYMVNVRAFYPLDSLPDDSRLLRELPAPVLAPHHVDERYLASVTAVDQVVDTFRTSDTTRWDERQKPWIGTFFPDETVEAYVSEVVPEMTGEDWSVGTGTGFVLLFPHLAAKFGSPRLRVPVHTSLVWLWGVLTTGPIGRDLDYTDRMAARNKAMWEKARAVGGVRYPIGSIPVSPSEWREHYGPTWAEVVRAKDAYDPDRILTPGPGIFAEDTVATVVI